MIEHGLVCLLKDNKVGGYKTLLASKMPSIEKLREVYFHNLTILARIIEFCEKNEIKTHRVSSSLFPLLTFQTYREKALIILEEALAAVPIKNNTVSLNMHPDQFILLSSANSNVNEKSRYELDITAHIANTIPIDLVNIHVGSATQGKDVHTKIFKREFAQLDEKTKKLLSLENDEKNYHFLDVLHVAQENNCMMVPDFHHERCYQKRDKSNPYTTHKEWNINIDINIIMHLNDVFSTYANRLAKPTFHLSSPIHGWGDKFKENCSHSDYIHLDDYPVELRKYTQNKVIRMDIEAKAKDEAVLLLEKQIQDGLI